MRAVLVVVMVWLAGPLWAQGLSDTVLKTVKSDPAPFLDLAADLIHGFGGAGGIDRAGVDQFIALERAAARAAALRRLAVADLDFDGAVTREELGVLAAAASAKARGRLWTLHEKADLDGDGMVSAPEAAEFGRAQAMQAFGAKDEALMRAVLTFDANADGLVSLEEVKAAVAALGV